MTRCIVSNAHQSRRFHGITLLLAKFTMRFISFVIAAVATLTLFDIYAYAAKPLNSGTDCDEDCGRFCSSQGLPGGVCDSLGNCACN